MCKFYSAIILPTGDLIHDIHTSSHEDLIQLHNLNDDKAGRFAKLEYTSDNLFDLSTYELRVDENIKPEWLTDSMLEKAERKLYQIVKKRIITEDRKLLIGGIYIVAEGVKIETVKDAIIEIISNTTINNVRGNATINDVRGNARINNVWDNATINDVRGNARINNVWDNARINDVRDNATINDVRGNARINNVGGNARINDVGGNARINDVWGNATIKNVWGNATINNDNRVKK